MYPFVGEKGMSLRSTDPLMANGLRRWWSRSVPIVASSQTP
jgi:hypothetical protein